MKKLILPALAGLALVFVIMLGFIPGLEVPVLHPAGFIAMEERWLITVTLLLCSLIVVPVFLMLFIFAWKYRASNQDAAEQHAPEWDHDSWWTSEFVWWLLPTAIILTVSVLIWQSSRELDPFKPLASHNPPITIQVVALDWKWLFIYPEQGIATVNMLEFPEDTPIHFQITADAPMNSFWIPSLGGQIMAMQGMTTELNLIANTSGTYEGMSANLSGSGFAGMRFTAQSVSREEFDAWVLQAQGEGALSPAVYAELAKPSQYNAPTYYSLPDAGLYTSIIMRYMMPHSSSVTHAHESTHTEQTNMPVMESMP